MSAHEFWIVSNWPWFVWYFIGCMVTTIYFNVGSRK